MNAARLNNDTLVSYMSIRDYFAGLAMQKLLCDLDPMDRPNNERLSKKAYEIADAMILERERD